MQERAAETQKIKQILEASTNTETATKKREERQEVDLLTTEKPSPKWKDSFSRRRFEPMPKNEAEIKYAEKVRGTAPVRFIENRPERQSPLSQAELNEGKRIVFMFLIKSARKTGHKTFEITKYNKKILNDLILYFGGHKSDLDLNKGVWIFGDRGSGKTAIMEAFSYWTRLKNLKSQFITKVCKDIELKIRQEQKMNLEAYTRGGSWCFDDLGEDESFMLFGANCDPMKDILTASYNRWSKAGRITHATTNMPIQATLERYGDRIESRVTQMFNVVFLDSEKDYRKS